VITENLSVSGLVTIILVCLLFLLYHLINIQKLAIRFSLRSGQSPVFLFFAEKIKGLILFGVIPFLLIAAVSGLKTAENTLTSGNSWRYWYILLIFLPVISFLSFNFSKKKTIRERYPRTARKKWTLKYCIIFISGWIIYILGYEFLFRGVLWQVCYKAFGFWVAIAVNVVIYAAVHLDQGLLMSLRAIPFGILLCLITFLTGSFLFAFLIHSWMASNYQTFLIYNDPDRSLLPEMKEENS
jgi:membrane protease YdiL (CAAX protease family)